MAYCHPEGFICPIAPENMAKLATLFGEQVINSSTVKKLLKRMWESDFDPATIVEQEGLAQINDREMLSKLADEVIKTESLWKDKLLTREFGLNDN